MSKGMHSYCSECGGLITNALGACYSCINEAHDYQEPWECDEFPDYDHDDIDYDEWVGDYE